MIRKIFLIFSALIVILVLLAASIFIGIPVGFSKGRLIVSRSYSPDDFSGRRESEKFYFGVRQEDCRNLDGIPTLAGIGVYFGCRVK